jgi:hypothetical protein
VPDVFQRKRKKKKEKPNQSLAVECFSESKVQYKIYQVFEIHAVFVNFVTHYLLTRI